MEEILEEGDVETVNRSQRVVLLAEAFDYEVLVTAEWLWEGYAVDIRCYRVALAKHGEDDFLTCTRAYPPPELTDIAIRRRREKEIGEEPADWDEALKSVENQAVVKFFQQELAEGRSNNVKFKNLRFFIGDRRRFVVGARQKFARAWQHGRFDEDIEFWTRRLGEQGKIQAKWSGRALRFYLYDETAFSKFKHAVTVELLHTEFHGGAEEEVEPELAEEMEASEGFADRVTAKPGDFHIIDPKTGKERRL
jgi:hypothetical protein